MLAAVLSSGSNRLDDSISSGHLLRILMEHLFWGWGLGVSVNLSPSLSTCPLCPPCPGQQLSTPYTLLLLPPGQEKGLRELSGAGSKNSGIPLMLWISEAPPESLVKRLVCSISFAPGPKFPGMDEEHGVCSSTQNLGLNPSFSIY